MNFTLQLKIIILKYKWNAIIVVNNVIIIMNYIIIINDSLIINFIIINES